MHLAFTPLLGEGVYVHPCSVPLALEVGGFILGEVRDVTAIFQCLNLC